MTDRRWTAKIEVEDRFGRTIEVVDANLSRNDLQREQAQVAIAEAAAYLRIGIGEDAYVTLYKTTRAGTQRDQSFSVWRDDSTGQIRAHR